MSQNQQSQPQQDGRTPDPDDSDRRLNGAINQTIANALARIARENKR